MFKDAIAKGVGSDDFFGFAAGKEGERYLGFMLRQKGVVDLDETSLLIQREAAVEYRDQREQEKATGAAG